MLFTQYRVLLRAVPACSENQPTVKAGVIPEQLLIQRYCLVWFRSRCNLFYYSWALPWLLRLYLWLCSKLRKSIQEWNVRGDSVWKHQAGEKNLKLIQYILKKQKCTFSRSVQWKWCQSVNKGGRETLQEGQRWDHQEFYFSNRKRKGKPENSEIKTMT